MIFQSFHVAKSLGEASLSQATGFLKNHSAVFNTTYLFLHSLDQGCQKYGLIRVEAPYLACKRSKSLNYRIICSQLMNYKVVIGTTQGRQCADPR